MTDTEFSIDSELPDDPSQMPAADFDPDNIRVNFSTEEAEAKTFEPIKKNGWYKVAITDGEMKACGPNSKNPGKPYWNLRLTIQEGEYENRNFWDNVMLFHPALYSLAQLMTAHGKNIEAGDFTVPPLTEIVGTGLVFEARIVYVPANAKGNEGYDEKNNIRGYRQIKGSEDAAVGSSLMP